jgi:hypothetical protein
LFKQRAAFVRIISLLDVMKRLLLDRFCCRIRAMQHFVLAKVESWAENFVQ